jgi:holo-[acyl-carrier protein] synthase
MIAGIGVDNVQVVRIERALAQYGERFERKIFSDQEISYCRMTPTRAAERYAARFAAREAFAKAIGTGIRMGFRWKEVTVEKEGSGRPVIRLHGTMRERYGHLNSHLSLSHTGSMAVAIVILESPS